MPRPTGSSPTLKIIAGGGVGMLGAFVLAAAGIIGLVGEASFFRRQAAMSAY